MSRNDKDKKKTIIDFIQEGDDLYYENPPKYEEALNCYVSATKLNKAGNFDDIIPGFSVAATFYELGDLHLARQNFIFYSQRLTKLKNKNLEIYEKHMDDCQENYEFFLGSLEGLLEALDEPQDKLNEIKEIFTSYVSRDSMSGYESPDLSTAPINSSPLKQTDKSNEK